MSVRRTSVPIATEAVRRLAHHLGGDHVGVGVAETFKHPHHAVGAERARRQRRGGPAGERADAARIGPATQQRGQLPRDGVFEAVHGSTRYASPQTTGFGPGRLPGVRAVDLHVHLPVPEWVEGSLGPYREPAERYFRGQITLRTAEELAASYEAIDCVGVLLGWDAETATRLPRLSNDLVA